MYRTMRTIERCDTRLREMINRGQLFIFYYSPRGQEAVAAAAGAVLRDDDYLVTTYRGLHDQIAKGVPLPGLVSEMLGKADGVCGGRGGPMHITDPSSGLMVTTGIVGGGLPIANGLALASKLNGDGRVTICSFGDGATNIGAFHEALNLAAVWDLPTVFLCQNNEYGEFTPRRDSQRIERIADRAAAYGMPGVDVDGNDPDATFRVIAEAVETARTGGGPTLVEAHTYRFMGHFYGDPMAYMDPDELARATAADPVPAYRARLLAEQVESEGDLAALEQAVDDAVGAAIGAAVDAAAPAPETVEEFVYAVGRA
jgi:pyruvate dehydrogenase E1 component alpha subunit